MHSSEAGQALSGASESMDRVLNAFIRPARRPASDDEARCLSGASRDTLPWGGQQLAVWRWGAGTPVLLLHGWESRASHMTAFVPPLLQAGFSAIALDAPAHGESTGEFTNVIDYGRAVVGLADRLCIGTPEAPFAGVIAHSVGSAAALYAYAHGVHTAASVQLCGPSSLTRVLHGVARANGLDSAGRALLVQRLESRLGVPLSSMNLSELNHGLRHPALVIHDAQDTELHVGESRALVKAWPQATLLLVEGLGHRRLLRDAAIISRAADFLLAHWTLSVVAAKARR